MTQPSAALPGWPASPDDWRASYDTMGELAFRVLRIETFLRELDPAAFDRADALATAHVLRFGAQRLDDVALDVKRE